MVRYNNSYIHKILTYNIARSADTIRKKRPQYKLPSKTELNSSNIKKTKKKKAKVMYWSEEETDSEIKREMYENFKIKK